MRTCPPAWLCSAARLAHPAHESRDTAHNMNRRRMIRRGATYGPHPPQRAAEDGAERGIAAFVICASLIRQFNRLAPPKGRLCRNRFWTPAAAFLL